MADNEDILGQPEYWDDHYSRSEGETPTHEWFRSFADLGEFFQKFLFQSPGHTPADNPVILHLGSGDSEIPSEFDSRGYSHQVCVDFSTTVVQLMTERHKGKPGIQWKYMDVRNMTELADKSIGVAFDKGTLDAMIHGSPWSPPEDVKENTSKYLGEVHRVLADDGIFLYVTFRQPHFMKPILNAQGLWYLDLQVLGANDGGFDYYGWVMRKVTAQRQEP